MALSCVDDAIRVWRKILMTITGLSNEYVLNGESVRGPEFVTIKNGQKIPIGYDESFLVTYCDPIDDISITDSSEESLYTNQSYELHVIVYGNQCKKLSQTIKNNLYANEILDILRDNDIGLLNVPVVENTSSFMVSQTYVLRSDIRIRFDIVLADDRVKERESINDSSITIHGIA